MTATLRTYAKIQQLAPGFARFTQEALAQSHNEAEFERNRS